jgi:4-hydroxy-3-polyprenylbenzoate decarboxylase
MKAPGGGKALLIERAHRPRARCRPFQWPSTRMGSWKRMALVLGAESVEAVAAELGGLLKAQPPMSFREAIRLLSTALDLRHAKPKRVQDGPCQEVVHRFDPAPLRTEPWPKAPDILTNPASAAAAPLPTLLNLPILKCWPLDAGRFITLPCVVTRDPDTGRTQRRVCTACRSTTTAPPACTGSLQKVAARHGRRYYEQGRTHARGRLPRRRSGLHLLPPLRPCPTAWTSSSWPATCARNPSNWSRA